MSVEEYEQSCRKKLERNKTCENLIVYLRTGKHGKELTEKDKRQALQMVSSYHWDDAGKHIFINIMIMHLLQESSEFEAHLQVSVSMQLCAFLCEL